MEKASMQQSKTAFPYFSNWFTGKIVLITGATSGIGREIAKSLSSSGARLLLCGTNKEAMNSLKDELKSSSHPALAGFLSDISNNESLQELITNINKNYEVDILINNAGIGHINDFCKMSHGLIHTMINLNIIAVVELCRALIPRMQKKSGTGILNVGSTASFFATPGSALYGATKRFLLSFTDALHQEMLSSGVHVTGVYPGNTHSRFLERSTGGKIKGWKKAMSPVMVAELALEGLSKNKMRVVPGYTNKLKTLAPAILPASILLAKIYKSTINHSTIQ